MKKWMATLVLMMACSTFGMTGCGETSVDQDNFGVVAQELNQVSYERTKPSGKDGIAYRVIGNGAQDIVLVHGWSVSGAVYDNMIAELAGPEYRIIAIDLRGTGDSFKPNKSKDYKLDKYYDDVKDVIKHANATNFILVGHSMGGAIAQLYAAKENKACKEGKDKKCVKGLVLMSPVPASGFPLDPEVYGLFEASGADASLRRLILSISSPDMTQADIEYVASAADSIPALAVTQSLAAWTGANFANKLNKIKAPTMVMVSDDPFMPVEFLQQTVADPINNAFVNYFPGSGHYLQVEDPVQSAAEIEAFINNLNLIQETYEFTKAVDKKGIGYRVIGDGPQDVVLVHGWSVSGAVYDNLIDELEGPDYRIIAIDLRGAGQSFKPTDGYTLDNYYKDVKDVINHAKAKNFILVGHSMGGAIAQQYASKENQACKDGKSKTCVKGLVLMSPVPASGFPLDAEVYGLFEASGADASLRRLILSISSPDMTQADIEYVASAADSIPAIAVTQSLAAWTGANFANKLNKIKAPTMVMVSDDPFMPVEFLQQTVADPINNAFVNYFPGSGHYLQVEDPVQSAAEIEAFINNLNLIQETYEFTKAVDKKGIGYRVIGDGPQDVVLVHGWSVSGAVYDNLIDELEGPDYRIIAIDLRGAGQSFKPTDGYTLDNYYKDVKDVINHAKAKNFILVGHSMGGAIAQKYAAKENDECKAGKSKTCVKGLVLMSPVPASGFPLDAEVYGLFEASGADASLRRLILSISSPDMTQADIEYVASAADSIPAIAVTQSLAAWTGANFAKDLRKIKAPTMVMVSDDPFMPASLLQELVADPISDAFVNYFPGSGHYLQVEDPATTAIEMTSFIESLP